MRWQRWPPRPPASPSCWWCRTAPGARKARKLLHLNPALAALPRVSLAEGMASRYRLRKAPGEGALSTIEAIAAALDELEAPRTHEALLKPFDALIEGQIAAMGEDTYRRNHLNQERRRR